MIAQWVRHGRIACIQRDQLLGHICVHSLAQKEELYERCSIRVRTNVS